MKQLKIWLLTFSIIVFLGLGAVAGLVFLVDPFFSVPQTFDRFSVHSRSSGEYESRFGEKYGL